MCWCSLVHVRGNAINSLVLIGVIEKMEVPMWIVRMNASDEQWTSSIFYLFLFVIKDIYIDLIWQTDHALKFREDFFLFDRIWKTTGRLAVWSPVCSDLLKNEKRKIKKTLQTGPTSVTCGTVDQFAMIFWQKKEKENNPADWTNCPRPRKSRTRRIVFLFSDCTHNLISWFLTN